MQGVSLLYLPKRCLRDPETHGLARLHNLLHRSLRLLDRHLGIHSVQVIQVDVISSEPPQGTVYSIPDTPRAAIWPNTSVLAHESGLGSEHYPVAQVTFVECLPNQLFVLVRTVDLGSVYQSDAELDLPPAAIG
jgi:hypothetical protein